MTKEEFVAQFELLGDEEKRLFSKLFNDSAQQIGNGQAKNKQLVAYLSGVNLQRTEIDEELKKLLPAHMMPRQYVILDALPTLPNGKLDESALGDFETKQNTESTKAEKLSLAAKALVNIWQEVLHVEPVSIYDNFFELGGDSILAIQIISKARNEGINLAPSVFLEKQTIVEVLESVNLEVEEKPELQSGFLTPIQSWFFETQGANNHWNLGFEIDLNKGLEPILKQALNHVLQQHSVLRSSFKQTDGKATVSTNAQVIYKTLGNGYNLVSQPEIDRAFAALHQEMNLETGKLVGALHVNGASPKLLVSFHHLVIDPVSLLLVFEELGETIKLIQENRLKDYTKPAAIHYYNISQAISNMEVNEELPFWQEQCAAGTSLPVLVKNDCYESEVIYGNFQLGASLCTSLMQIVKSNEWLTHDVLFSAAIAHAVGDWAAQPTVSIGLEQSLRNLEMQNIRHAIGWMTSYFPLKLNVYAHNPLKTLLEVHGQWEAVQNQGVGYGILRYKQKESGLEAEPQIIINYMGKSPTLKHKSLGTATFIKEGLKSLKGVFSPLLEFNISLHTNQFNISYAYAKPKIDADTVESILRSTERVLEGLADNEEKKIEKAYQQKQVEDVGLDDADFDELLSQF